MPRKDKPRTIFQLMDSDSANLIGCYDSLADALDALRWEALDGICLGAEADGGLVCLACGNDLARLVFRNVSATHIVKNCVVHGNHVRVGFIAGDPGAKGR